MQILSSKFLKSSSPLKTNEKDILFLIFFSFSYPHYFYLLVLYLNNSWLKDPD